MWRASIAILLAAGCAGPEPMPDGGAVEVAACECSDLDCVEEWIEEHLGCDLCAHVACEGGTVGVCVPCEP
jgi:hypothetical protein